MYKALMLLGAGVAVSALILAGCGGGGGKVADLSDPLCPTGGSRGAKVVAAQTATSPGSLIVFNTTWLPPKNEVYLYDRTTSTLDTLPNLNVGACPWNWRPSISADGRYIAFEGGPESPYDIHLYDRTTSSPVDLPGLNSTAGEGEPSISGDGRLIAFTSNRAKAASWRVYLYDRSTSRVSSLPRAGSEGDDSPSISADGRYIALTARCSRTEWKMVWDPYHQGWRKERVTTGWASVCLYSCANGRLEKLPGLASPAEPYPPTRDAAPSLSGDGRLIAFYSNRGNRNYIYLYDRNTSSLVDLPGLSANGYTSLRCEGGPDLSSDGRYITFDNDNVGGVFVYDRDAGSMVNLPGCPFGIYPELN
jgi:Tol biopolymer transport system component